MVDPCVQMECDPFQQVKRFVLLYCADCKCVHARRQSIGPTIVSRMTADRNSIGKDAAGAVTGALAPGTRILGVDFSGASDAGRKIWIAEGRQDGNGSFELLTCVAAVDLPGGGKAPAEAVPAL